MQSTTISCQTRGLGPLTHRYAPQGKFRSRIGLRSRAGTAIGSGQPKRAPRPMWEIRWRGQPDALDNR